MLTANSDPYKVFEKMEERFLGGSAAAAAEIKKKMHKKQNN